MLIDGERIVAVGADLGSAADEVIDCTGRIVLPGLIDGHAHLWETALRGIATESWAGEYERTVPALAGRYRPEDMRAATYGGAIELLANGVTTVLDACHPVDSPAHADASIDGLRAARIRARFGFSFQDVAGDDDLGLRGLEPRILEAQRLHGELGDNGLVSLAIALNEVGRVDTATSSAELRCARELGVIATIHSQGAWEISTFAARGELGPDLHWIHATKAADEELDLLARDGGAIASVIETEVGYQGLHPMTGRATRAGVPVTLGTSSAAMASPDLLMQLRMALQFQRKLDAQVEHLQGRTSKRSRDFPSLTSRQILLFATAGAADALGLGDRIGRLTPGREADILVLDTEPFGLCVNDPVTFVVQVADRRNIEGVYVAGRERVRDGRLVDVDADRMRADLDDARARIAPAVA